MPSKAFIPILVGMMLFTGVCNTLLTKYQDMQCVENCTSHDPSKRKNFEQPIWQTAQMFVGEMGCWIVVAMSELWQRYSSSRKSVSSVDADGDVAGVNGYTSASGTRRDDEAGNEREEERGGDPQRKPLLSSTSRTTASNTSTTTTTTSPSHSPPRRPLTGLPLLLLALPAICDICGTTLMNIGLVYIAASIYQMVRGALVLFVGLFSFIFLKRRLSVAKWSALVIVVAGVAVVGLSPIVERGGNGVPGSGTDPGAAPGGGGQEPRRTSGDAIGTNDAALQTAIGILLIFSAQLFTASQFVIEESILHRYTMTPLRVIGYEGIFGLLTTTLLMLTLHLTLGRHSAYTGSIFDMRTAWAQITGNRAILISSILIMFSLGGFNFFGLTVTKNVSATSRSTIDTCRTLFIWVISLGLRWERFRWLQVAGFTVLVYGTFLFNNIVGPPGLGWLRRLRGETGREEVGLLPERPIEHN